MGEQIVACDVVDSAVRGFSDESEARVVEGLQEVAASTNTLLNKARRYGLVCGGWRHVSGQEENN